MKDCIDNNPSINYFYSTENEYTDEVNPQNDIFRYFIRQEIESGVDNQCFITKDGGSDQTDFDNNYKAGGIETL